MRKDRVETWCLCWLPRGNQFSGNYKLTKFLLLYRDALKGGPQIVWKWVEKSCVILPAEDKQNAIFPPNFTQPGAHLLEHPCSSVVHMRQTIRDDGLYQRLGWYLNFHGVPSKVWNIRTAYIQDNKILSGFQNNVFHQIGWIERTIVSQHFISRSGGEGVLFTEEREPNNVFFLCLVVSL